MGMGSAAKLKLEDLQRAVRAGDSDAENVLLQLLSERFRLLAYQKVWNTEDAKEVAQDALVAVIRELKTLDIHTSFAAWAQRVFENRLLAYIKTKQAQERRVGARLDMDSMLPSEEISLRLRQRLLLCFERVARVSRRYARILNLHYQGFSTQEICRRLQISENNCYVLLFRSRTLLKNCLEEETAEL
jgi:RNA polymerase sigma factor (sigma-70 family)